MRSGKLIDISKSSLISLKAELTRKQEEVKKVKEHESYIKLPPKPKPIVKTNPGVEERNENDIRLSEEEVDLLKKSKEVLEIKAAIYDKCQKGELVPNDGKSHYLVDFGRKSPEPSTSQQFVEEKTSDDLKDDEVAESDGDEDQNDEIDLDPDEWIEYTDCLGRTRKCHRSDLDKMKDRDKSLAAQLNMQKENQPAAEESISNEDKVAASGEQLQERELLSKDMHLEELRKKWEEQEIKLANKSEIHYEDVLFNEARSHGVGYWAFSTDAEKRAAEQEMFRKVRAETEQKQQEAAALRRRRDEQRQARLIAARERQRARLGLPPISKDDIKLDDKSSELVDPSLTDVDKKSSEEGQTDDLQRKLMRAAHVRPWDVGKDGVKEPVMTQEEWLEKKRSERIEEFAPIPSKSPPKSYDKSYKIQYPKKKLFGRQKESLQADASTSSTSVDITVDRRTTKSTISATKFSTRNEALYADTRRGLGTEIPPPDELLKQNQTGAKRKHVSLEETASAIEAGLKYLREEHEKTQNAPTRGAYNMI